MVSRGYLNGVLEIFDMCPKDILCVSLIYMKGFLDIFDICPRDI